MKITKLKSGMYSATAYIGIVNGKQVNKRFAAPSEKRLKEAIKKYKASLLLDKEKAAGISPTLRQAIDSFIEARSNILSPTTIRAYVSMRDNSFKSLMDKELDSITTEEIQAEINIQASKVSSKTIRNRIALFTTVYSKYALEPKKLTINIPPKQKADINIPTKEEVNTLLSYIRSSKEEYTKRFYIPVLFAATLGLRRGEIGALTWKDINFNDNTVSIDKAIVKTAKNKYAIKPPKSYSGYRVLNIPPVLLEALKGQNKKKPLISLDIDQISDGFRVLIKKVPVKPFRFHDLRHYFASTLLALNIPDLYAMKLTGHSTPAMLKNVYQHTFKSEEDRYKMLLQEEFKE